MQTERLDKGMENLMKKMESGEKQEVMTGKKCGYQESVKIP